MLAHCAAKVLMMTLYVCLSYLMKAMLGKIKCYVQVFTLPGHNTPPHPPVKPYLTNYSFNSVVVTL